MGSDTRAGSTPAAGTVSQQYIITIATAIGVSWHEVLTAVTAAQDTDDSDPSLADGSFIREKEKRNDFTRKENSNHERVCKDPR